MLDGGFNTRRWERWRPNVALCQHEEARPDLLVLLWSAGSEDLLRVVSADVAQVSPGTTVEPVRVELPDPWDFEAVYGALHELAGARRFSEDEVDLLVHITTGTHVAQICLFLLTESRHFPGRLLQTGRSETSGPRGTVSVIDLDLSRYDRLNRRFAEEQAVGRAVLTGGVVTRNELFTRLIGEVEAVAVGSRAPLLLTGPTGAGKTALARRVYELKRGRGLLRGAFVEVNCATLRGDAAMSALFGHVRGAFTGAVADRVGLLRAADGGLLFLDEVGELGLEEQAMLLRAIEERRFSPMGSEKEQRSEFQLVTGTNRDLGRAVAEGRFREDLWARLRTWSFRLPGLVERREDIAPNVEHELAEEGRRSGRRLSMNREARERFLRFAVGPEARWTGNFRDLGAAVHRMSTLAPMGRIDEPTVEREIERLRAEWGGGEAEADPLRGLVAEPLDPFDAVQLAEVVRVCRRSRSLSEAGRSLFAVSRQRKTSTNDADRLSKYLARFGLDWERVRASG